MAQGWATPATLPTIHTARSSSLHEHQRAPGVCPVAAAEEARSQVAPSPFQSITAKHGVTVSLTHPLKTTHTHTHGATLGYSILPCIMWDAQVILGVSDGDGPTLLGGYLVFTLLFERICASSLIDYADYSTCLEPLADGRVRLPCPVVFVQRRYGWKRRLGMRLRSVDGRLPSRPAWVDSGALTSIVPVPGLLPGLRSLAIVRDVEVWFHPRRLVTLGVRTNDLSDPHLVHLPNWQLDEVDRRSLGTVCASLLHARCARRPSSGD